MAQHEETVHGRPELRKPVPPGATEHVDLHIFSLVERKDGSILADNGRVSTDGGLTWSEPKQFVSDAGVEVPKGALLRLQSGRIALSNSGSVWFSGDEGETWRGPVEACPGIVGPGYLGDEMIQLSSGRLLYPVVTNFNPSHPEFKYEDVLARSIWRGEPYNVEGHQHLPEFYSTFVSYSDDDGATWQYSMGYYNVPMSLFGWFDEEGIPNGHRGILCFGECTVAEMSNGHVMMYGRSDVNRVLCSYSVDAGGTWSAVLPTMLANSGSPPRLRIIPSTGDLLCVWNQVSREEIQNGYRRGRLSAAISKDNGASWGNFKTLELSAGLEDIDRIRPEYPIKMIRSRDNVGHLPDDWTFFHYANVRFAGDKVCIMYSRCNPSVGIAEQNLNEQNSVLRIYPVDWFYE